MKQNGIAKTLQIIGWVEFACAIMLWILGIFEDISEMLDFDIGISIVVSSFITCMVFQGFAEVIELLHKNSKTQEAILDHLQDKPAPKTVLEDIESNLPQI